jgi:hypothetical protein
MLWMSLMQKRLEMSVAALGIKKEITNESNACAGLDVQRQGSFYRSS